ncbi:MAG: pyridoxal 5'-phosphate synthase glutaminase subunit PdxT [Candidatus Peregrinibacteria bacterium]|nr:pyridoxal 5'-phosphate synthase glutaminase subunit PdxT [Candidatus Peregrinibacteria bacterium]MDZ4244684.1 pyridoxal 5'-phosphate synthase glutaminase subunit PdxT [Candidatus Gracilibacteria bacterium]
MKIGILAIQGSVAEHKKALIKAAQNLQIEDFDVTEIRLPEDLFENYDPESPNQNKRRIQGIILPGGESTAQSKLLKKYNLFEPLKQAIIGDSTNQDGLIKPLPVWGTCAGAILLAKEVIGHSKNQTDDNLPESLKVMDIRADRNAYGTQSDSFITEIQILTHQIEAVFIRAPKLSLLTNPTTQIQVLATYKDQPIAIRQGHMLATSFHPELTNDTMMHEFFLKYHLPTASPTLPKWPLL